MCMYVHRIFHRNLRFFFLQQQRKQGVAEDRDSNHRENLYVHLPSLRQHVIILPRPEHVKVQKRSRGHASRSC